MTWTAGWAAAEALAEIGNGHRPLSLHGLLLLRDGRLGELEVRLRVGAHVGGEVHGAGSGLLDGHLQRHGLLLELLDALGEGLKLVAEGVDHAIVPEHDLVGQA